ncbi:MAG: WG repeat-containing protein [Comamonas sp.]|jgi:hypothetical protein|nr:WG repeat-containing protein [Comamonas sp.]
MNNSQVMQKDTKGQAVLSEIRRPAAYAVRQLLGGLAAGTLLYTAVGSAQAQAETDDSCLRPVQGTASAMEEICAFSEGLAAFKLDGLWGYMDREGKVRIAPQFKQARAFSQGLAPVLKNKADENCDCEQEDDDGHWGFVDTQGQWAIAPKFANATPFSQDLAVVSWFVQGKINMGFIDRKGDFAMPHRFYRAQPFRGDKALVEPGSDDVQAFVARSGQIVALPKPPASLPSDTRVSITQGRAEPQRWLADLEIPARSISMHGKVLPLTRQQRFENPVSPEAAVISVFQNQWRKGLMHESGRWLQPPEFSRLGDFENGVGIGVREAKVKAAVQSIRSGNPGQAPAVTRPAPPSVWGGGGSEYFLVSAQGRLLTPAYAEIRRERGFFVAKSSDGKEVLLLGARGERLSVLNCQKDSYYQARALTADAQGWSALNTCDGQHWVQSPEGRSWSGTGQVESLRATPNMALLRFKDDAQIFSRQGKALLSASMRAQLKGLERVWLTADEQNPAGKATRPLAVFATYVRGKDGGSEAAHHALTPTGRWVPLPAVRSVEWYAPRDPQEQAAPVVLRTDEGMGVIDAQGHWLLKPERNRSFFSMPGGWVGQRGKASQPDLLWNARGQKVEVNPGVRAHAVAAGLNWLELEGRWQLLDAQQARLLPLDGLDGAQLLQVAGGQVIMGKRAGEDEQGRGLSALYSARGQRLSSWLRLDYLQPILDDRKVLHGWVGSRSDEAAGTYSILLSSQGKPLTRWLPLNMRPAEGEALVFFGNGDGQGVMTPQGKVLQPALYGQVSMAKHHWTSVSEGKWKGLLDGQGRWLAVVANSEGFDALAKHSVARLGSAYDGDGALDLNGRHTRRVQGSELALDAAALPPKTWQITPSPLSAAEQWTVDDGLPLNWFVQGFGKNAVVIDMQGVQRLQAVAAQSSLQVLPGSIARRMEVQGSDDEDGRNQTELLDAKARRIAVFDNARLSANREARLSLQSVQPLPDEHPLARPLLRRQRAVEQGSSQAAAGSPPAQEQQLSLVDERDGRILGGGFDALGQLREGRAFVSHMGNLGVVNAQGELVVQSAWRCGTTAVLLNQAGEIHWPPELSGKAGQACPKP